MRQLVRILTKLIPQSACNLPSAGAEGGGGNRLSEDQIREYLKLTLGGAPQPDWGLRDGWASYVAGAWRLACNAALLCFRRHWVPLVPSVVAQLLLSLKYSR